MKKFKYTLVINGGVRKVFFMENSMEDAEKYAENFKKNHYFGFESGYEIHRGWLI